MIKTKSRKSILLILLSLALVISSFIGIFGLNRAMASVSLNIENDIVLSVDYGDDYIVMSGDLSYGTKELSATPVLTYPSGKSVTGAQTVAIDEYGKYSLSYSADFDGEIKCKEYNFTVAMPTFSVSQKSDSATYGKHELLMHREGEDESADIEGSIVTLSEGGKAYYSAPIDFETLDPMQPLIEFYALPQNPGFGIRNSTDYPYTAGTEDYRNMYFKFTDIYDEDNYITIAILWGDYYFKYALTASRTNQLSGMAGDGSRLFTNGRFGTGMRLSFGNVHYSMDPTGQDYRTCWNRFYFDYEEKQLYVEGNNRSLVPRSLVLDYDDSQMVSDLWEGFSDGKAKLEVYYSSFTGANGTAMFTYIGGQKITSNTLVDTVGPDVLVDESEYNQSNMPDALVGLKYPILSYTTRDAFNLGNDSKVNVYAPNGQEVEIVNGAFTPTTTGVYKVIYSAVDRFGNETKKSYDVNSKASIKDINIGLTSDLSMTAKQGEVVTLPEHAVDGGSGNLNVETYVVLAGSNQVILPKNNQFIPTSAGQYLAQYYVTDYLGQPYVYHFTINVEATSYPIFTGDPVLPEYVLLGRKYILPQFDAVEYSTGSAKKVDTKIIITDGAGERTLTSNEVVISDTAIDNVKIRYQATANGQTKYKEYVIPTVVPVNNSGRANVVDYFATEVATKSVNKNGLVFNFTEDGTARFIKPLMSSTFEVRFSVEDIILFDKVDFIVTDEYNPNHSLKFTYYTNGGLYTSFSVNDGTQYILESQVGLGIISLSFNDATGIVHPDGSSYVAFDKFMNGDKYDGFVNNSLYLDVKLSGVTGNAQFIINRVNGQALNEKTVDRIGPNFTTIGQKTVLYAPGSTVVIRKGLAMDVLDSYADVTVSVYQQVEEDGDFVYKYLVSDDGITLQNVPADREYFISGLKSDRYYYEYFAVDSGMGNDDMPAETVEPYSFEIQDIEEPSITIGNMETNVSVGSTITLAKATVNDNKDGKIHDYAIYVLNADGYYENVENDRYTITKAGVYKFIYVAFDQAGNMGMRTYEITAN